MDIFKSWLVKTPIAHRGLHNADIPENSLKSFQNAIDNNFAIELDLRIIDDGTVVVFHDEKLSRMTDSDGYVGNLKFEDLKDLKLNKTAECIPTFKEVLELVNEQTPILIEIKNSGKVGILEGKVLELLKNYKGQVAIQSFNPYSVEYFKINAPHILRGQLSSFFKGIKMSLVQRFFLKRLMLNKVSDPDFIAYDVDNLPNRYVAKYKTVKPILAWTVKSNSQMIESAKFCDNIIFEKFIPENTNDAE